MKFMKKGISVLVILCMLLSQIAFVQAKNEIKLDNDVSFDPMRSDSAYVTITDTVKTNNMTVKFGNKSSVKDASALSLESVTLDGVSTKKLYSGTDVYITLDKTKFTGNKYLVLITYYDFGPDYGNFHLEYNSSDQTLSIAGRKAKRYTIRKTGMNEEWKTVSYLIDDASFSGAMEHGADIRIVNGAFNSFAKIEVIDYSDCEVTNEGKIVPSSFTDSISGRTTYYINYNGKPAIRPYVTAQGWNYEGTKFLFGSYDTLEDGSIDPKSYKLYEYDIINYQVRCLDTQTYANGGGLPAIVTPDNMIYYGKADGKTWKMNWLTYEKEQTPARVYGTMNVTNDGKWVSGYGGANNEVRKSSLETGHEEAYNIDNARERWVGNTVSMGKGHPMVNPMYPHLLFFCHEGTTNYIPDRLWLANYNTDEAYNMFYQVPYSDTETAETSGHEVWSMDGEMMYWVKYTFDKNAGQSGLMRMDKFGKTREYINGDYKFWHCYPSGDHNFVVGDTNDSPTKVVIVNTNTYQPTVLSSFRNENSTHPNQPHPHISYNNYSANWQFMKNKVTCIGWNIVRDITAHAESRQEIPFGDYANIITTKGTVSEVGDYTAGGVTYKKANSGNGLYIDILSKVCASTNVGVTVKVTYLDKGTHPLNITYTSPVEAAGDLAVREDKTYSIAKSGSGIKKTVTVNLGNINANDAGKFMSDLCFASDDGVYISDIKVTADVPGEEMYDTLSIYSRASENESDYNGLRVVTGETVESYNSNLYHVDDIEGWQQEGITQSTVDRAKNAGVSYVTLNSDGAWMLEANHKDALKYSRNAYFVPHNHRQLDSRYDIGGNLYFVVTGNEINENDKIVTFTFNYIDGDGFTVYYASDAADGFSSFDIAGNNTGLWKRASVTVGDASISSTNTGTKLAGGTADIKIESKGNEMYISEVSVSKQSVADNNKLVLNSSYYNSYGYLASLSERVSVSAENNVKDGGIICTETANYSTYNSTLYHVDDVEAWTNAGLTQENIDAAIDNGCEYITKSADGAWKYEQFTDADGVTKTAFYAPRNFRPIQTTSPVNSNLYFRLTDETITENDSELILEIEYLDTGDGFTVTYVSTGENNFSSFSIRGENSGKWKTVYVPVNDAVISSTNSGTKLATWQDDIKIGGSNLAVSQIGVIKRADGSDMDNCEIITHQKQEKSDALPGDVVSKVSIVTNKSQTDSSAIAFNVIYNPDGSIKSISSSNMTKIAPGRTALLETDEQVICAGETHRTFVWGGNLKPVEQDNDPLGVGVVEVDDASIRFRWDNTSWPGYFFNIYSDGEMVGRTTGKTYLLENMEPGAYSYYIEVADLYGRVIFRSRDINIDIY